MTISVSRPSRQVTTRPLYRMDPSRELADLQDRLGQLTQSIFGEAFPLLGAGHAAAWAAPVDIEETDDAFIVDLDLPNVREEDVQIELKENELRIFGVYRDRERSGVLRRRSRLSGEFEFDVTLPGDVDVDRVDATLEDGVLRVSAPKATTSQARRIEVHRAEEQAPAQQPAEAQAQPAEAKAEQPAEGQATQQQKK